MSLPVIDRYEIRRGLGRGAMGTVYLGWDPKMGREVAVKVLLEEFARNPKHRQRFEREARAIAALKHPNIVDLYDYGGSPDQHLYLVMEYVQGPHTGQLVREHGPFVESVLTATGMGLADALRAAHEAGIIHRDIKPENVFVDGGRVVLGDFGIVKAIHPHNPLGAEAASTRTDVIGTPGFMAPEQLQQQPLDQRTDVFSFGALLYYLGSRSLPYEADSPYGLLQAFRDTRPTPLSELRPELSEPLSRLVQDCLEVAPEARPPTMEVVFKRLREVLEATGAGDPRDVLEAFVRDPVAFRRTDLQRTVDHLVGRLKIAVRDQDGVAADEIRARLGILDPHHAEAVQVTGVTQLLREHRGLSEDAPARTRPRVAWVAAAAFAAAGMVAGTWWVTRAAPTPPPAPAPQTATLRVQANAKTFVFADGRALGTTPDFPEVEIPSGTVALELVHERRGKLQHTEHLEPGDSVVLTVDWKRRRVRVRRPNR